MANVNRVGVNLTWLTPSVVGGSEDGTIQLLNAILDLADAPSLVLFAQTSFLLAHPALANRCDVVTVNGAETKTRRVGLEHTWLPGAVRERDLDLMHHAGGTIPARGFRPATVTVHDLQPLELPRNFEWKKRAYLRTILKALPRAERVLVPSSFVRSTVVHHLALDPSKVEVVGWPMSPAPKLGDLEEVRRRFGVGERYWVWPAVTYSHKNHDILVRAFLSRRLDDIELVLPGEPGPAEDRLRHQIETLGLADRIHRIGRVSRIDLDTLVSGAIGVAVPSEYEGFGLPVLDAVAANVAVVSSRAGSLPEVVGPDIPLVDAHDLEGWVNAIDRVSNDPEYRSQIVDSLGSIAARYEPSAVAQRVVHVWNAAAGLVGDD